MTARIPIATYRVQLTPEFGFDALRAQLPYLAALGISDVYVSPILRAMPGSTHGYDVIDPTAINPELGGEEAFARLVRGLRDLDLGLIVDIVPNHMGIADGENPWWEDVLRHGRESAYARVFDIDWDAGEGRLLLPILGDRVDDVLARGELTVEGDGDDAYLRYGGRRLPLAPGTLDASGGTASRALLDAQHYRLDFWREGKSRINYRRFFEIDTLAGVRQEDPEVFDLTHALITRLLREGAITGLRIDHIDGLADPAGYLHRLHQATGGSAEAPAIYLVVEKILGRGEALPESWATHGTTGYDFLNDVNGVFVAHEHEAGIVREYRRFTGRVEPYLDIAYATRRAIVDGPLAGRFGATLARLRAAAPGIIADVDAVAFEEAARAIVASLPVYRTYHTVDAVDPEAPLVLHAAMTAARAADPRLDPIAVEAVCRVLEAPPEGPAREAVLALQQLMPAVAAKGIEDCAFYRYVPLASVNAVGGEPDQFGERSIAFHIAQAERLRRWPAAMTTIATHDHKQGPDMRARLDVLSEIPDDWAAAVERWAAINNGTDAPHRHDQWVIYQTLLGCWPPLATAAGLPPEDADFVDRITAYAVKATREAGERTSWLAPNEEMERRLVAFITRILDPVRSRAFLDDFVRLATRVARVGAVNSLSMLALQLGAPGVPDIYQGRERWDFGLVDPDNRRPVDYAPRAALAEETRGLDGGDPTMAARLMERWPSGEVKQYVLSRMLRVRRDRAPLFLDGDYLALNAEGTHARQVIAFARQTPEDTAIVVATRLVSGMVGTDGPLWAPGWDDTMLELPPSLAAHAYRDAIAGLTVTASDGAALPLTDVLGRFPVALLVRVD